MPWATCSRLCYFLTLTWTTHCNMDICWILSLEISCIHCNIFVHFHIVLLWENLAIPCMILCNSIHTPNPFAILALYLQSNTCWKISIITSWITFLTTFHIGLFEYLNITFMGLVLLLFHSLDKPILCHVCHL